MHLAELNTGHLVAPTDDPRVAEFMANLEGDSDRAFGWEYLWEAGLWKTHGCRVAAE